MLIDPVPFVTCPIFKFKNKGDFCKCFFCASPFLLLPLAHLDIFYSVNTHLLVHAAAHSVLDQIRICCSEMQRSSAQIHRLLGRLQSLHWGPTSLFFISKNCLKMASSWPQMNSISPFLYLLLLFPPYSVSSFICAAKIALLDFLILYIFLHDFI